MAFQAPFGVVSRRYTGQPELLYTTCIDASAMRKEFSWALVLGIWNSDKKSQKRKAGLMTAMSARRSLAGSGCPRLSQPCEITPTPQMMVQAFYFE